MSDKPFKTDLSEQLSRGLKEAIQSYQQFQKTEIPSDAKGFTGYHNACKAALMHIALLLKLIPDSGEGETMEKNDWLTQARLALKTEDEDELFPD